jgi:FkbM family methyltransferase
MNCQNNEIEVVLGYFSNLPAQTRCVLSIGENDGITFSNSYDLIQSGWEAVLIEPSPKAFERMQKLHIENKNVICLNYGIANESGEFVFNESSAYKQGQDVALVSTLIDSEMDRWLGDVNFEKITAKFKTFQDFLIDVPEHKFDFISIDAEGYDYEILKQIDLDKYQCKCLCIEYNGKSDLWNTYENYAKQFGMRMISNNPENLIFVK